ncbi:hypothetical protein F383_01931 [Gossypium arboreum]|nr:hypothetical protein F383_01931 [Gossypium arboreum]
MSETSSS